MSHFWHKPLNVAASAAVVVGMMVVAGAGANLAGASNHVVHNASNVTFSDNQFTDTVSSWQLSAVVDTETTALTQPLGNLSLWGPNAKYEFLESTFPKVSNHGKTYNFALHSGMKWSNGDAITNKDYLIGWKLADNPNTGACVGTCSNISGIALHGSLGITVKLAAPYAPALSNAIGAVPLVDHNWDLNGNVGKGALSSCLSAHTPGTFSGCDTLAKAYEAPSFNYYNSSYVTAGPFQISSYDATSGIIQFKQNPNYTSKMPGGKPHVSTMTFLPYGSIASEIAGAANGDTDVTQDYTLANVGDSSHSGTLNYYHNFVTSVKSNADPEVLTFNQYNKKVNVDSSVKDKLACSGCANPFVGKSGLDVRLALLLAFNRTTMIQNAFAPLSRSTAASLVSYCAPIICTKKSSAPYADKSIKGDWDPLAHKYLPGACPASKNNGGDGSNNASVKAAEALLKKAGYGSKHHLTVYLSSTTKPYRYFEQAYLQKCWDALGSWVTVNTENIVSAIYFAGYNGSPDTGTLARGRFEADLHGYGGVPPDPDGWKGNFLGKNCEQIAPFSGSQANMDCFFDSTIDKSLFKAGLALNTTTRKKWYDVFQEEVVKHGDWSVMAPLPNIITWDHHPSKGFNNDPWVSPDTWNAYSWQ